MELRFQICDELSWKVAVVRNQYKNALQTFDLKRVCSFIYGMHRNDL